MLIAEACARPGDEDTARELEPPRAAYTYDPAGRLRSVSLPDGKTAVYSYDAVGNVVGVEHYDSPDDVPSLDTPDPGFGDPPEITGFSPAAAAIGDTVTVEGSGFAEDVLLDAVAVDGASYLTVDSASSTSLEVTVGPAATSGRLSVGTPAGDTVSDDELFVVPLGLPVYQVDDTVRAELGEPVTVEIEQAEGMALVAFHGERGQNIDVVVDEEATDFGSCGLKLGVGGPGGLELRHPDNIEFQDLCATEVPELDNLPSTGTYTLLVATGNDEPGSATLTLADAAEDSDDSGGSSTTEPGETGDGPFGDDQPADDPAGDEPGDDPSDTGSDGDAPVGEEDPVDDLPPGVAEIIEPPTQEDVGFGPEAGGVLDGAGAFPVDLATGYGSLTQTDLVVGDTFPIELTRSFQLLHKVPPSLGFGVGSSLEFDVSLRTGGGRQFAEIELPSGYTVTYLRTSEGTDLENAEFLHTESPGLFYGSQISWNGDGWDLTLLNGTTMVFGAGDEPGLRQIRDPQGNEIVLVRGRNELGRATENVVSAHSSSGRWLRFDYDDRDRVTEATDHLGRSASYTYDEDERLVGVAYSWGDTITYSYDEDHRLISTTGPDGVVWVTNDYDEDGRVVRQVLGDGSAYAFSYVLDADGLVTETEVTYPNGTVRRLVFAGGYWVSDTVGVGTAEERMVTAERAPESHAVTGMTDATGRHSSYEYDDQGNLVSSTSLDDTDLALGTQMGFDSEFGQLTSFTDATGSTTDYSYDETGNLGELDLYGAATTYDYDEAGRLVAVTDASGGRSEIAYEMAHRVTVTDPTGVTTSEFYDAAGRLAVATDAARNVARYSYDDLDRLVSVTDASGATTTVTYDAPGNVASVSDANGNTTSYAYDPLGRLVERTDPLGASDHYEYDAAGNLVAHTDRRDIVTRYAYDQFGRPATTEFGVIADGAESTITYRWDDAGRLASVDDTAYGTTTFTYDDLDRVISEATPDAEVTYEYDAAGRRVAMTLAGGSETTYDYDDTGVLASITQGDLTVASERDELGQVTDLDLPEGITAGYEYDPLGQLTEIDYSSASGETTGWLGYDYDETGLRTALTGDLATPTLPTPVPRADAGASAEDSPATHPDAEDGADTGSDADDSSASAAEPGSDANADTTTGPDSDGGTDTDSTSDSSPVHDAANRLVESDGHQLVYDEAGNLTDDGTNTYTWDARGQLVGIEGEVEATFAYDPFGRRVTKTVDGVTNTYIYDGPNIIQQATTIADRAAGGESDASDHGENDDAGDAVATAAEEGVVTYMTGLGIDELYARIDADGKVTTYLHDALGSAVGLADEDGSVRTRYSYGPFGATTVEGDDDPNPFAFTGRELDETGLYYYRARYYDPGTGRFLSEDPLGFAAGDPNLYTYTSNSPTNFTDPTGTQESGRCVGASLATILLGLEVVGQIQEATEAWVNGEITREELFTAWANVYFASQNLQAFFQIACGIEQAITPGLRNLLSGRGINSWDDLINSIRNIFRRPPGGGSGPRPVPPVPLPTPDSPTPSETPINEPLPPAGDVAFHHTVDQAIDSIMRTGLRPGSYATPTAGLSPLQAHIELALNPAGGPRNAVLQIDLAGLRAAGYEIPEVTRVTGAFGMAGGGYEIRFPYEIPPEFLKVIYP